MLINLLSTDLCFKKGSKIANSIFEKYIPDELSEIERGYGTKVI